MSRGRPKTLPRRWSRKRNDIVKGAQGGREMFAIRTKQGRTASRCTVHHAREILKEKGSADRGDVLRKAGETASHVRYVSSEATFLRH